jgi:enterochelin esterase family protein
MRFRTVWTLITVVWFALALGERAVAAGRVEFRQSAPSPALGRPVPYAIYIPGAAPPAGERWPVLYLLHGLTGRDGDWFSWGNLATILDRLIASGEIRPLVVVAPGVGDSWYVDNPDPGGLGKVATALTRDLIPAIDARLPTASCREGRAIGGLSMGGYGALYLSLTHPDLFEAAISLSGAIAEPMRPGDPRLEAPFIRDLYKGAYGEPLDPERFNAFNLFKIGAGPAPGPRPEIWMAIGRQDYPELIRAGDRFARLLEKNGFSVEQRGGEGRHFWDYWQRAIEPALVWLSPRLATRCE